jgi:DNA-directed RNA polymerase subunit H (RpoH/RPB5)
VYTEWLRLMTEISPNWLLYIRAREWMTGLGMKVTDEMKTESEVNEDALFGQRVLVHGVKADETPIIIAIIPTSTPFSTGPNVASILNKIPRTSQTHLLITSLNDPPQLSDYPNTRHVKHILFAYDPRRHVTAAKTVEVIKDKERIKSEVKYDLITDSLASMPRVRASTDRLAFWLGAEQGDVIKITQYAEDTVEESKYYYVTA